MSAAARTVLVVEDDGDVRESLQDVLGDEGFQVELAADGLAALAILRRRPRPGVILLDWMLPRCDGPTFLEECRKDPALAGIPVIVLSALSRLDAEARRLAVAEYLRKPVDLDVLVDTVERHCQPPR